MRSQTRALVMRQLEAGKRDGLIAEYLISWPVEDAPPAIAVWSRQQPADHVRDFIAGGLAGVDGDCITIIDEPPPLLVSRRNNLGHLRRENSSY
jgi:hypothetical protein